MMDYDELKEQAEELAKGKTTDELARWGFIYAYVSNHMSTFLADQIKRQDKLLWSILIVIALGVVCNILIG